MSNNKFSYSNVVKEINLIFNDVTKNIKETCCLF